MIKQMLLLLIIGGPLACASDYYVDCKSGNEPAAGLENAAGSWNIKLSAGGRDPPTQGLYVE